MTQTVFTSLSGGLKSQACITTATEGKTPEGHGYSLPSGDFSTLDVKNTAVGVHK